MSENISTEGAHTPNFNDAGLSMLSTRYLEVEKLPWGNTVYDGIEMKILFKDSQSGAMTALFRWQAGAKLPMHEHTDIEQSYVLEGSLCDFEGECKAGDYAWRPAGSQHEAWSPNGCLLLAMFLKPNRFLEGPEAEQ
tara:strand:+ start:2254 stop:2664 length:411 start_codon:yes stop_codon:yes gene_type:complete